MERSHRTSQRLALVGALATVTAVAILAGAAGGALADARPPVLKAGNPSGIVYARDSKPRTGSPDLVYHGGTVMTNTAATTAIFWGSSWGGYTGDKIDGIDSFYQGVGGTTYLGTTTEYTDSSGGHVSTSLVYVGHDLDGAAAPRNAPSTSTVLSVVAATLTADNQAPATNGYYPVYSDQPRGHANYCAWHSWGTINGTLVQFAFFFNLDGDPGCDPQDTHTGHSQGLAALGNVSGHELSEMLTDRHGDAWYDQQGEENADKCAWTFGPSAISFANGSVWKIQGNWSNRVNDAGSTGSYNGTGCIDGN